MQIDEVMHERQADTETAVRPRAAAVRLPEALEDVRQRSGWNALPRVAHHDLDVEVAAAELELHHAAGGRELHGVLQQVADDLAQPLGIRHHDGEVRRAHREVRGADHDALRLGRRAHGIDGRLDDAGDLDGAQVEPHPAGDDP